MKPDSGSLGLILERAERNGKPVLIVKEDKNNKLQRGDRIIEVNDISIIDLSHAQAVELIKESPKLLRLTVSR